MEFAALASYASLSTELVVALVVAIILFKIAFFTIKRVIFHLITGWATWYALSWLFGITLQMDLLMWTLTALFGPIAVIGAVLWHTFM